MVGMFVAFAVIIRSVPKSIDAADFFLIIAITLPGITTGTAQWLFLRSLKGAYQWIIASALGYPFIIAGIFLVDSIYRLSSKSSGGASNADGFILLLSAVFVAFLSIPLGLFQWVFMRRHYQKATRWIPVTCAGYFFGSLVELSPPPSLAEKSVFFGINAIPIAMTSAALTGYFLLTGKIKQAQINPS